MQTYTCPSCKFHFSEADRAWDTAIDSGQCSECLEPLRNSAFINKRKEEQPSLQQPFRGNSVLTQNTLPASSSAATHWKQVSAEEAKKHPLYGVRGWLVFFAFSTLIGFAKDLVPVNVEAIKAGIPLGTLLAVDKPEVSFVKWVLWTHGLIVVAIYGLLFSKHPSFRPVSIYLLLGFWPAVALAGFLNPFPALGELLVFSVIPWAVSCTIWVAYLQKSKRVRVTFEHRVIADRGNVASTSQLSSSPGPAITREPERERQFNDASTETHMQATPSGASKAMSSSQPTANPIAPVSIPVEPSQNTIEAHEDRLYEQIAQEMETNTVDKGLWTKAYAQAGGDDRHTRVLYIKMRFARLLAMEKDQRGPVRKERE